MRFRRVQGRLLNRHRGVGQLGSADRCVLHIGSVHAGAGGIRRGLEREAGRLARDGVCHVCFGPAPSDSGLVRVALGLDDDWSWSIPDRNDRPQTVVLSDPGLVEALRARADVQQLRDRLRSICDRFEVIMYVCRQDHLAVCRAAARLDRGSGSPDIFPEDGGRLPWAFDYDRVHRLWSDVFGPGSIQLRVFAPGQLFSGDVFRDFCAAVRVRSTGLRWRAAGSGTESSGCSLPRAVAKLSRAGWPVLEDEARAFLERCCESNRLLRQRLFPMRASDLFEDDFGYCGAGVQALHAAASVEGPAQHTIP